MADAKVAAQATMQAIEILTAWITSENTTEGATYISSIVSPMLAKSDHGALNTLLIGQINLSMFLLIELALTDPSVDPIVTGLLKKELSILQKIASSMSQVE